MALGITLENVGFFLKSNLPVWPENCWIRYLAQVFPEPGADAIAVRGPEDFCEKKYVSTVVRFLSYSPNPTTQFRNHEFWIFIKYWTNCLGQKTSLHLKNLCQIFVWKFGFEVSELVVRSDEQECQK